METVNALSVADFEKAFGSLFEHSPWVARAAAALRPFADGMAMETAMMRIVWAAPLPRQLALLKAHPELAAHRLAKLSEASASEQASAGLDRLGEDEMSLFDRMNHAYREKFGFPFIICVRLNNRIQILEAMARRLSHGMEQEIEAALTEIGKIAHLRLRDILHERA